MILVKFKRLLVAFCGLISLINLTSATEPLIFNPYTLDVFNVRAMYLQKSTWPVYAAACPFLDDGYENDFNTKYSSGHKSLFIRGPAKIEIEDAKEIQCEKSFELSIVERYSHIIFGDSQIFSLGYEVFYDRSAYPETFNDSYYFGIGEISRALSHKFNRVSDVFSKMRSPKMVKKDDVNEDKEGNLTEEGQKSQQKMGFMWFTKIQLRYKIDSWSLIRINYKMHRHADQLKERVECQNYDLGQELYRENTLDEFYSPENQKRIFDELKLPQSVLPGGADCQMKRRCVEKYNLVPSYVFQASSTSSPVSCTDLTTVPIWHEVSKPLLDQLTKFLTAMAQITQSRIEIIPGVYKTLALPAPGKSKLKEIYLDAGNSRIPMPKILYKMVRYMPYACETCLVYGVLIVIHNEPDFEDKDKLCSEDKCLEWGWERIQKHYSTTDNEWKKSNHIYCCELNDRLKKKLGIPIDNLKYTTLKLKIFPSYGNGTFGVFEVSNMQRKFEEMMDNLFPTSGSVKWDNIPNLNFKGEDNKTHFPFITEMVQV